MLEDGLEVQPLDSLVLGMLHLDISMSESTSEFERVTPSYCIEMLEKLQYRRMNTCGIASGMEYTMAPRTQQLAVIDLAMHTRVSARLLLIGAEL